jgi:hypothetical protein
MLSPTLSNWKYEPYFEHVQCDSVHPAIHAAEQYVVNKHLERHEFFEYGKTSPKALKMWVTQELIVTGPFSQLIFRVCADIRNVHVRGMLSAVAAGEHGPINSEGIAESAHPWLLHKLREHLQIPCEAVKPFDETLTFLRILEEACESPLRGIGALGVGNERLLIPEYTAVRQTFFACIPDFKMDDFFVANISEDWEHYRLMMGAAAALIAMGHNPDDFLESAKRSVDSRYEFYDALLARIKGA